jgi:hypothetical protein
MPAGAQASMSTYVCLLRGVCLRRIHCQSCVRLFLGRAARRMERRGMGWFWQRGGVKYFAGRGRGRPPAVQPVLGERPAYMEQCEERHGVCAVRPECAGSVQRRREWREVFCAAGAGRGCRRASGAPSPGRGFTQVRPDILMVSAFGVLSLYCLGWAVFGCLHMPACHVIRSAIDFSIYGHPGSYLR